MPSKATKYGIKVWMVADVSNGYVLNFDVYLGKEANQRRIYGLGYDVDTKMIRPFMNKNHHVYFDNFFSSVTLLEQLETNDTYACACDLQRITGYLAEAYIETHKVQFDSTW